jgi:hypothetical protein
MVFAIDTACVTPARFNGVPIYINDGSIERVQVRFPRSKKRRIRKKWAQRDENFDVFVSPGIGDGKILKMHSTRTPGRFSFHMNTATYRKLRREVKRA